ncbi:unnamed protein product [Schistosoma spindalis]|nr:unnamed protein product [Schistosoma spindale]
MDLESLNILHEICLFNGIQYKNLNDDYFYNYKLFILFNGFKKCISLQNFPYLTELIIISQNINKITKLETCPNLKKLWLCECHLIKIENLNTCKQLIELYLYDNNIKKIENLTNNNKLEYLWLNNNQIYNIEGLNHLKLLKQLNLSGNHIINLNNNLLYNQQLEMISLSGNQLWNINDILLLSKLPYLKTLNINEPEYKKNPLCYNINLPMILIYQLPQLCNIDYINIDYIDLKYTINIIIKNKKYYYMMKYEHYQTIIENKINSLKLLLNELYNKIDIHIKYLDKTLKLLQNIIRKQENMNILYDYPISINLIHELNQKINDWENIHDQYKSKYNLLYNRLQEHLNFRKHIYDLELQMFGYIEINEINNKDNLFIDCNEFLNTRFCYHDEKTKSIINGIKILHLYKINNRIFNQNFNKKYKQCFQSSITNLSIKYSTFSNYLFIVCPEKIDELKLYINIIRNGLQIGDQYKLTNNLNIADNKNLQIIYQYISEGNLNHYDPIARLLLIKVSMSTNHNLNNNDNNDQKDQTCLENIKFYENQSNCYCLSQIKKPDLLKNKLFYPEYIVELEYLLKNNQYNSIFDQFNIETNIELNNNFQIYDEKIKNDQNFIKSISILSSIEDDNKLYHFNEIINNSELLHNSINFYFNQTNLFLIDFNIIKNLQFFNFSNLTYLNITHCQLENLSFIQCNNINNNLITLIINHNQLNSLESIGYMPNLIELQVDYNQLICIIDNVSILLRNTPKLEKLSWRYNPWNIDKLVKLYTIHKLSSIKLLNFQFIHYDDIQLANKLFNSSIITSNMIENLHSNNNNNQFDQYNEFDQNLTLFPIAYYHDYHYHYYQYLYNNPIKLNNLNLITSLCLQSLNIYKIEHLNNLTNLKYLSLNYNYIKKIEGLNNCINLIELSIEYNLIESIDNINHLIKLQSLLLSNNKIKKMNKLQFKSLINLYKLNLSNNQIYTIDGIYYCQQLIELYLGNNQLNHFMNILYLKNLLNLNILELYGNPLCNLINNYIYQLIYYIKSIKSIDGYEITINDFIKSNELYFGHLSYEYLLNYLNINQFINIVELNLSKCMLYKIDYIDPNQLIHLKCINLEKNYLKSFGGLLFFKNLQIICLNDNNIESLFSNHIYTLAINDNNNNNNNNNNNHHQKIDPIDLQFINLYKSKQLIYPYLNVLHLANNNIHSLKQFQFHRMNNIQTLFLQNNELHTINGIEGLNQLKELILDNNKIKLINELTFLYNWTLNEIHLENNNINELNQLSKLENLKRLYIGCNKLNNFIDLENFAKNQQNLYEISLISNPITTKQIHRFILIYYIPKLQIIDGIHITKEERDNILHFYEEKILSNIINYGIIQSSNWYNHSISKVYNPVCEITLPEIINKKSIMNGLKINDNLPISMNSKEYQTVSVFGKQIHQNITNTNDDYLMNKIRLNNLSRNNLSIQSDINEKNALTIKSIHNSNHSFIGNLIHYQHQSIKQKNQYSTSEIKNLSMNSFTRPHSQTNKVSQLKSLKHNKNNKNNNNNNKSRIKAITNITINTDNNSNRSSNSNQLIKFSAMSTNLQH